MANLPIFAVGTYDQIQPAIDSGKLSYPSYVFIDDSSDDVHNNEFAFIDKNQDIRIITSQGENVRFIELGDYSDETSDPEPDDTNPDDTEPEPGNIAYAFSVEQIEEAFEDESIETVILASDIEAESATVISLENGQEKTLDLNGLEVSSSIEGEDACVAILVSGGSTLNIEDSGSEEEGSVNGNSSNSFNCAVSVKENSTLNIYGGNYTCGSTLEDSTSATVYAEGGDINIYGGYFENEDMDKEAKNFVMDIKDESGSKITCYGGTFLGQNPADGDDSDTITGSTFVAEGYEVKESEEDGKYLYTVTEQE